MLSPAVMREWFRNIVKTSGRLKQRFTDVLKLSTMPITNRVAYLLSKHCSSWAIVGVVRQTSKTSVIGYPIPSTWLKGWACIARKFSNDKYAPLIMSQDQTLLLACKAKEVME